ncbi:MAG: carboxy terminal-processing peptidase [Planctomycetota bacterium]|nr:carboxy terminal-processing peptidase [Planctomycetota bacterium]
MRVFKLVSTRVFRPVFLLTLGLGLAVTAGLWSLVPAELVAPRPNDRHVTTVVTELLKREHLSKHPLDDEISRRGMKSFLKTLDPMKMYFLKSDIDEFMRRQNDLDDMLKNKDISFAYAVFQRFLTRVDERVKMVDELLKSDFDFATADTMVTDPEQVQYAQNIEQAQTRWTKRIKYDMLVLKGDKKEGPEAREKLTRRYHSFDKRMHQTDPDELLEMFLSAITTSYDPHTTYMSPSSLENFRILMRLNLEGIGAALQMVDGYTVISKIIPGGAADKNGKLKPEDRIVSVGQGADGEMVDVVDMKLNDVVKQIRGKTGTVVRLGVIPTAGTETKIYNITRATIELKDSEARGEIVEEGKKSDGSPLKIGVIDLPSFYMDMEGARKGNEEYKSTTRDVAKILEGFNQKGVDAVVLDLSRNGGGSLTEAISLTGLFIDRGSVVQVKDAEGRVQQYDDTEPGMAWSGPLVVVTSKFSASASEILAGAIQDYHRGLIVGDESTHGKGTVQSLLDLGSQLFKIPNPPNLGALKITMQEFYRPDGDSTQKRGVLADVKLPSISNYMEGISEADLDYAIEFDRVPAARYARYNMVTPAVIQPLSAQSQSRIGKSTEFAKLMRNIDRYKTQKAKKMVSLNEKEFFAERADLDADKEEEKQLKEQEEQNKSVIRRDYYFNEILAITRDYVQLLGANKIAKAR